MLINTTKLARELVTAGISTFGNCNSDGVVWDDNGNEIQDQEDVRGVLLAHDPTPEAKDTMVIFDGEVIAHDFIVMSPKINNDPDKALDEAIAEMEKGEGNPKSIALVALSLAKYLKEKRVKIK